MDTESLDCWNLALMAESAYAADLKSVAFGRPGSSPGESTK